AALSGVADARAVADVAPFDPDDDNEFRMRSAVDFATSFKCPARLYYGSQEGTFSSSSVETARRAKAAHLDVEAIEVPGDHMSMTLRAIPLAIEFFQQHR